MKCDSLWWSTNCFKYDNRSARSLIEKNLNHKVYVLTAGAPPPSIIFKKMEALGFEVMHVYGLTETYGHILRSALGMMNGILLMKIKKMK